MPETEGVIQYELDYRPDELPGRPDPAPLLAWFVRCRAAGLIGQDPRRYDGYAYGNISLRADPGFLISGSQTGGKAALAPGDLAWVRAFDTDRNRLEATGPARPSSEAMSHGEIYRTLPHVRAVIHVHSPALWQAAAAVGLPVTDPAAGYGTPAMAREVRRLLRGQPRDGLLAMGGHEDGIIAFGPDMDAAGRRLLDALEAVERIPEAR
jgi:ribulose-5-phosphate 4-epimerase/fuculose-1-phosphate aldolase